jgi:thiol-disulfide isomerase/thioredoxin
MKTLKYGLTAGMLCLLFSCSEGNPGKYTLRGSIAGSADGKKVYLYPADNIQEALDSAFIKDSFFAFENRTLEYPRLLIIEIEKNIENVENDEAAQGRGRWERPVIPVFAENAEIEITALLDSIPTSKQRLSKDYSYKNIHITGSASHDLYLEFFNGKSVYDKLRSNAFNAYIDYLNPGAGKKVGPVPEGIALVMKIDDAAEKRIAFIEDFVKRHSGSPVAVYAAESNLDLFSVDGIDKLIASLSSEIQASPAGQKLAEKAAEVKKTAVGAQYADFDFEDPDGNAVKLSEHLGKGKYVLLEFWASWCGPCRADIPHLKEVYRLYHKAGFEVIGVSLDEKKEDWLKALKEERLPWLQVSDLKAFNGNLSKLYNFNGIPTCVLISPDGKIVTRNMRGSWMDKKLIELYGNKFDFSH